jgi:hypothetical protein
MTSANEYRLRRKQIQETWSPEERVKRQLFSLARQLQLCQLMLLAYETPRDPLGPVRRERMQAAALAG